MKGLEGSNILGEFLFPILVAIDDYYFMITIIGKHYNNRPTKNGISLGAFKANFAGQQAQYKSD